MAEEDRKMTFAEGWERGKSATLDRETQFMLQRVTESCLFKSVFASGAGFALGGVFGMFMSSIDWHQTESFQNMKLKEQLKVTLKDMGSKMLGTAKSFGMVGGVFSAFECAIETFRAKNDIANGVSAGCLTGATLAYKAGPQAMITGCAGFAAFSAAIDYWIRHA